MRKTCGRLIVSGWGYDLDGSITPSDSERLHKSNLWRTGPVDLIWDANRKVWTCHGTLLGKLDGSLSAGGSATMSIWNGTSDTSVNITVWNWFSSAITANTKVIVQYVPTNRRFYVISADCA
jgi:hypothetical protein